MNRKMWEEGMREGKKKVLFYLRCKVTSGVDYLLTKLDTLTMNSYTGQQVPSGNVLGSP